MENKEGTMSNKIHATTKLLNCYNDLKLADIILSIHVTWDALLLFSAKAKPYCRELGLR